MKILVVHAWLRGNLGDVLQLSVLLSALRELRPTTLDVAGFPARPSAGASEIRALCDRYFADLVAWYGRLASIGPAGALVGGWWARLRKTLFGRYDVIVCAPGAYLADYDRRAVASLLDITFARERRLPIVLSSHSIGPLPPGALDTIAQTTARIAREPSTHAYLQAHGISSTPSADFAFLYPYAEKAAPSAMPGAPFCLVFLRGDNLNAARLRITDGVLFDGSSALTPDCGGRLVLATSDPDRDARFLEATARRLGIGCVACRTVSELVTTVTSASAVVSDRYHPAICAAALGKPSRVLPNREPNKMAGLARLLADHTLPELQALARNGLAAVRDAVSRRT